MKDPRTLPDSYGYTPLQVRVRVRMCVCISFQSQVHSGNQEKAEQPAACGSYAPVASVRGWERLRLLAGGCEHSWLVHVPPGRNHPRQSHLPT